MEIEMNDRGGAKELAEYRMEVAKEEVSKIEEYILSRIKS